MEKVTVLKSILEDVFGHMGVSPVANIDEYDDCLEVIIEGRNLSYLIGYRGESLNALQHFLAMALNKRLGEWNRVLVDINGYKQQRNERVEDMTRNFIDRVRFFNKEIEMRPMNSSERYWVHTFVSDYDDVISESVGEGRDRRVVLKPV